MKKIDFYFDFLSPYSYFAWKRHKMIEAEFVYKPVLMGKLFSHFEFRGPGEIPVKRDLELRKCFQYADMYNIPFIPPHTFPFNPMGIIRLATISAAGDRQTELIELIFNTVWSKGIVLEDPDLIEKLLVQNHFESVYEKSFEREAKLELKSNIKEAIESNIFGVPTFRIDKEIFWGNDSLELLAYNLSGNDNWDRELYNTLREK